MRAPDQPRLSAEDLNLQSRLRRIGIVVLLVGIASSAAVFAATSNEDTEGQPNTKQYEYQMEVIGGKINLLATEVTEWAEAQCHGRKLARLLLVLSLAGSSACFDVAHRLNFSFAEADRPSNSEAP